MPYYFAYGSNMNPARVAARIGTTRRALPCVLHDHELRFDKASRVAGIDHANVAPVAGGRVEGALFELVSPGQIDLMDPFEGHPVEYRRHRLPVVTVEGAIEAWVYVAAPGTTAGSLRPAREYSPTCWPARPSSAQATSPAWRRWRRWPASTTMPSSLSGCRAVLPASADRAGAGHVEATSEGAMPLPAWPLRFVSMVVWSPRSDSRCRPSPPTDRCSPCPPGRR